MLSIWDKKWDKKLSQFKVTDLILIFIQHFINQP